MKNYVVFFDTGTQIPVSAANMAAALEQLSTMQMLHLEHLTEIHPCIGDTYESVVRSYNERCR